MHITQTLLKSMTDNNTRSSYSMILSQVALYSVLQTIFYHHCVTGTRHRRSQDFPKGGSYCVKVRVLTRLSSQPPCRVLDFKKVLKNKLFNYGQDIVMAFSPPVVGCLVKKGLQKGGHGHPRIPPGYALARPYVFTFICANNMLALNQVTLSP